MKNYLFRLDLCLSHVIDATTMGGAARFINHSCNPNCKAEKVDVDGDPKIVIFSCRKINTREELCIFL